jgi:hypothetical protein
VQGIKAAAVSEISIKNIERGVTDPRYQILEAIQRAFEKAGVAFLSRAIPATGVPASGSSRKRGGHNERRVRHLFMKFAGSKFCTELVLPALFLSP